MPNTTGLTSPRHAKHPLRTWLDALTATPLVAATVDALLLVIIAIAIVGTLSACQRPGDTTPGRDVTPSAGVVIPGPPPSTPATTWEQVGA